MNNVIDLSELRAKKLAETDMVEMSVPDLAAAHFYATMEVMKEIGGPVPPVDDFNNLPPDAIAVACEVFDRMVKRGFCKPGEMVNPD